jgi:hypothetical protein
VIRDWRDAAGLSFPYWLKRPYSTAGQGVREVSDEVALKRALGELQCGRSEMLMAQRPAQGRYGQVQGLFDHGRLVAVHTSVQTGTGVGGSAAARLSVDDPGPRQDIARLGAAVGWHGGLTLDYLSQGPDRRYIECNPRTVEPANAAASDLNIPELQVRLTLVEELPSPPATGRSGVRTHSTLALLLGAAAEHRSPRAVLAELGLALTGRGHYRGSQEQLTPIVRDPPSLAALEFVIARLLGSPESARRLSLATVSAYSVPPESIARVRALAEQWVL